MNSFAFLIRREFWEHRGLLLAPLIVAVVWTFGFSFELGSLGDYVAIFPAEFRQYLIPIFAAVIASIFFLVSSVDAGFFLMDALYAERKDQSILFWRSLPVSDTRTVLAKLATAMVAVPVITLAVAAATHLLLSVVGTIAVLAVGESISGLWDFGQIAQIYAVILYAIAIMLLWYAPVAGWLMLVSAWAKRSVFLWATLPPAAIWLFERIAFDSNVVGRIVRDRLGGWVEQGFSVHSAEIVAVTFGDEDLHLVVNPVQLPNPGGFLASPGLWAGLAVAALFLAGAVWLRRYSNDT